MTDQDSQDKPETQLPQQVSCQLCRKQLPADEAVVEEAKDYVHWFCGQDCYQRWQHEHSQDEESSRE
jgi:hypothetical protein